ncbi:MAG: hypothetical protein NTW59_04500, partial [Candidatus Diapherotrites archaeon]|nr:hypothetical protein [Candidatus Diapherotrites archaeon]
MPKIFFGAVCEAFFPKDFFLVEKRLTASRQSFFPRLFSAENRLTASRQSFFPRLFSAEKRLTASRQS